jgi:hypothetical protein
MDDESVTAGIEGFDFEFLATVNDLYIYTYTMTTVDTSNYFAIAVSDEQANTSPIASGSSTPAVPEDKASKKARRDQRIAEAVQRSKVEYTAENVYTERGVCLKFDTEQGLIYSGSCKSKIEGSRSRKSISKGLVSLDATRYILLHI